MSHYKVSLPHTDEIQGELADAPVLGIEEVGDRLIAWMPDEISANEIAGRFASSVEIVPELDWSEAWKARVRTVYVGPFEISPPWMTSEPTALPYRIVIDPGMAFGTGDHPTTRACLGALARNVRVGASVLDYGCGSGILGIAARFLGAANVLAVDCEEAAINETKKNSSANGVTIETRLSAQPPDGAFDVIVSNIQSTILESRLSRLVSLLNPGGILILAGILAEEGFDPPFTVARLIEHPWIAFECAPSPVLPTKTAHRSVAP